MDFYLNEIKFCHSKFMTEAILKFHTSFQSVKSIFKITLKMCLQSGEKWEIFKTLPMD